MTTPWAADSASASGPGQVSADPAPAIVQREPQDHGGDGAKANEPEDATSLTRSGVWVTHLGMISPGMGSLERLVLRAEWPGEKDRLFLLGRAGASISRHRREIALVG